MFSNVAPSLYLFLFAISGLQTPINYLFYSTPKTNIIHRNGAKTQSFKSYCLLTRSHPKRYAGFGLGKGRKE